VTTGDILTADLGVRHTVARPEDAAGPRPAVRAGVEAAAQCTIRLLAGRVLLRRITILTT
jgi:hypothetical protein